MAVLDTFCSVEILRFWPSRTSCERIGTKDRCYTPRAIWWEVLTSVCQRSIMEMTVASQMLDEANLGFGFWVPSEYDTLERFVGQL